MKKLCSWALAYGSPVKVATTAAEVAGGTCLTVGAAQVYGPAGWFVAGAFLLAAGIFGASK